uniref:Uncharacterized protein n=1 Tax=Thermosporothrix sp. COM3 TaxID=2490863 RepID=A0A455SRD3_9CHLR|nr:hypothetical protein KTC_24750 [Thermosporothrix sp. COM3]
MNEQNKQQETFTQLQHAEQITITILQQLSSDEVTPLRALYTFALAFLAVVQQTDRPVYEPAQLEHVCAFILWQYPLSEQFPFTKADMLYALNSNGS